MDFKERKSSHKVSEDDMAEFMLDLGTAFQEAGGVIPTLYYLKNVSAYEWIRRMAPNKLRICFVSSNTNK